MLSWNLREIETPGGSRSPVVVHTENEVRAVLIGLEPGQALGDHQVHERAWVVVLDGHGDLHRYLVAPGGGVGRR